MNSIFGSPKSSPQIGGNNMLQMIEQFNKFKNSFTGDPKQAVMQMLNSGQINNQQLQQAMQMAKQLKGILK